MSCAADLELGLGPEPGWTELAPAEAFEGVDGFVSADPFGDRIRLRLFRREAAPALVGKLWLGPDAQGPPGSGHGGCIAAVLDETMGAAAWTEGLYMLSVELTTRFRRRLPLGEVVRIEAWVARTEGRKIYTEGRIVDAGGEPYAVGAAVNIRLTSAQLEQISLNPMMVCWKRWGDAARR